MNPKHNSSRNNNDTLSGLVLKGTIVDRMRRMVPKNNPTTEIVTYTVQDEHDRKYYVDDYAPTDNRLS